MRLALRSGCYMRIICSLICDKGENYPRKNIKPTMEMKKELVLIFLEVLIKMVISELRYMKNSRTLDSTHGSNQFTGTKTCDH